MIATAVLKNAGKAAGDQARINDAPAVRRQNPVSCEHVFSATAAVDAACIDEGSFAKHVDARPGQVPKYGRGGAASAAVDTSGICNGDILCVLENTDTGAAVADPGSIGAANAGDNFAGVGKGGRPV